MYKPITMDARRVDELSGLVSGLRFFQQLPAHVVPRVLHAMCIRRLRAEAVVCREGDAGDSFCVVMRGAIAVYARRRPAAVPAAAAAKAEAEAEAGARDAPAIEGDADHSAPPSPRSAAAAGSSPGPPRHRRPLAQATGGSISIPASASVNRTTGSISVPTDFKPLKREGEDDTSRPPPPAHRQGISLVPNWVTPPTSDDDDDGNSTRRSGRSRSGAESDGDDTLEERAAKRAALVEQARVAARARLESEAAAAAEAELASVIAEEAELQRLEAAESAAEMECLATLGPRDSFGLLTILESARRPATLIALDDTELAVLTRTAYEALMLDLNRYAHGVPRCVLPSPAKYMRLLRMPAEHREDAQLSYLVRPLLANNRLLQMLDTRALQLVASGLKLLEVRRSGVVLQKQDDEADWAYIVVRGSISEHMRVPNTTTSDAATKEDANVTNATSSSSTAGSTSPRHTSPSRKRLAATSPSRSRAPPPAPVSPPKPTLPVPPANAGDLSSAYGPCRRLLLVGDMSPFPERDLQSPSFWPRASCTLLTREPCVLAKISIDYLSHILLGCARPLKGASSLRDALRTPGERRTESQLEVLDTALRAVTFFQFKPPSLRRALCARTQLHVYPRAASLIFHQGQSSDCFYIILSGSVSVHQKAAADGTPQQVEWDASTGSNGIGVVPEHGMDVRRTFGPCLSVLRAGAHFGDQALISTLPRNMTILTRGAVELMAVSRADYGAVFIPVLDEMAYHASRALQLLSRPVRSPPVVAALLDVLKHVPYFADMPANLRSLAIRHMQVETVEGDSVIFREDDEADHLYVIMAGSVGVHILDKKQKELLQAARAEAAATQAKATPDGEDDEATRRAEAEAKVRASLARGGDDDDLPARGGAGSSPAEDDEEEPRPKTEEEILAEQMAHDAELEVARLLAEKRARHAAERGSDEEDDEDDEDEDDSGDDSKDADDAVPTAAAARMQASSRGDVFTASGAGQYALARRLRGNSHIAGGGGSGSGADALANLRKAQEADDFKKKMAAAMAVKSDPTTTGPPGAPGSTATGATAAGGVDEPLLEGQLAGLLAGGGDAGREQVGHLDAAERTEQFGPCVVQLPSGSVVGEVALTIAGARIRRTATIITMEPTFFIKLHGDIVQRLTFGRAASTGGSMSQDAAATFLKTLDLLRLVRGANNGAGTGSHATFKRLAYHMKDRKLAAGARAIEQGTRSEFVFFIVSGSVRVTRQVLVNGIRPTRGGGGGNKARDDFITHAQAVGESFQRIDTAYLPPGTAPPYVPPPPPPPQAVNPATSATAPAASVPLGLPPVPLGHLVSVELTVVGAGELLGGLEALVGGVHASSCVVASSECLVLQMKRGHFLNLFPSRALDLVRATGEQRARLAQTRVEAALARKFEHANTRPWAAGLANMQGSAAMPELAEVAASLTPFNGGEEETESGEGGNDVASPSVHSLVGSASSKQLRRPATAHLALPGSPASVGTGGSAHLSPAPASTIRPSSAVSPNTPARRAPRSPAPNSHDSADAASGISSPAPVVRRHAPVLAPPVPRGQQLQSEALLQALHFKAARPPAPLTPVQIALGYTSDSVPPPIPALDEEAEEEEVHDFPVLPPPSEQQLVEAAAAPVAPPTAFVVTESVTTDDDPVERPVTPPIGGASFTPGSRDSKRQRPFSSLPRAGGSARSSLVADEVQRPSTTQDGRRDHALRVTVPLDPESEAAVPLVGSTTSSRRSTLAHSLSSALAAELSASSRLEQEAAAASKSAARRRSARRGSITIAGGHSSLGAVAYEAHAPHLVPTAADLDSLSATLSRPDTGGIIGIAEVSSPRREAIEDEHLLAAATANLPGHIGALSSRSTVTSPTNHRQESKEPDAFSPSRMTPTAAAAAAAAAVTPPTVTSVDMDVETRAVILMRAERQQIAWETGEVQRRGHKLMDKVRPTSYNISQAEKQAKLSRSLAWDKVQKTDPSSQSNAFLHSASPPLAVMNANIDLASPGSAAFVATRSPKYGSVTTGALDLSPAALAGLDALAALNGQESTRDDEWENGVDVGGGSSNRSPSGMPGPWSLAPSSLRPSTAGSLPPPGRAFSSNLHARDPTNLATAASPIIRSLLTPLVDSGFTSLFAAPTGSVGIAGGGGADAAGFFAAATGLALAPSPVKKPRKAGLGAPLARPSTAVAFDRASTASVVARLTSPSTTKRLSGSRATTQDYFVPSQANLRYAASHTSSTESLPEGVALGLAGRGTASAATERPATALAPHRVSSATLRRAASTTALPAAATTSSASSSSPGAHRGSFTSASGGAISPWASDDTPKSDLGGSVPPRIFTYPSASRMTSSASAAALTSSPGAKNASAVSFQIPRVATLPADQTSTSSAAATTATRGTGSRAGMRRDEEASPSSPEQGSLASSPSLAPLKSPDPHLHARTLTALSPFSPSHRHAALLSPSASSGSGVGGLGGSTPSAVTAGVTAFTKQSFVDERAEAIAAGARVVQDSHQSVYSRARPMCPIPGSKSNPATGPDSLSREELEALRRKRLYAVSGPVGVRIGDVAPTAFTQVMALSASLPDKLLAPRRAISSAAARADEKRLVAARNHGGVISKILQDFKEASEREPM